MLMQIQPQQPHLHQSNSPHYQDLRRDLLNRQFSGSQSGKNQLTQDMVRRQDMIQLSDKIGVPRQNGKIEKQGSAELSLSGYNSVEKQSGSEAHKQDQKGPKQTKESQQAKENPSKAPAKNLEADEIAALDNLLKGLPDKTKKPNSNFKQSLDLPKSQNNPQRNSLQPQLSNQGFPPNLNNQNRNPYQDIMLQQQSQGMNQGMGYENMAQGFDQGMSGLGIKVPPLQPNKLDKTPMSPSAQQQYGRGFQQQQQQIINQSQQLLRQKSQIQGPQQNRQDIIDMDNQSIMDQLIRNQKQQFNVNPPPPLNQPPYQHSSRQMPYPLPQSPRSYSLQEPVQRPYQPYPGTQRSQSQSYHDPYQRSATPVQDPYQRSATPVHDPYQRSPTPAHDPYQRSPTPVQDPYGPYQNPYPNAHHNSYQGHSSSQGFPSLGGANGGYGGDYKVKNNGPPLYHGGQQPGSARYQKETYFNNQETRSKTGSPEELPARIKTNRADSEDLKGALKGGYQLERQPSREGQKGQLKHQKSNSFSSIQGVINNREVPQPSTPNLKAQGQPPSPTPTRSSSTYRTGITSQSPRHQNRPNSPFTTPPYYNSNISSSNSAYTRPETPQFVRSQRQLMSEMEQFEGDALPKQSIFEKTIMVEREKQYRNQTEKHMDQQMQFIKRQHQRILDLQESQRNAQRDMKEVHMAAKIIDQQLKEKDNSNILIQQQYEDFMGLAYRWEKGGKSKSSFGLGFSQTKKDIVEKLPQIRESITYLERKRDEQQQQQIASKLADLHRITQPYLVPQNNNQDNAQKGIPRSDSKKVKEEDVNDKDSDKE